VKTENNLSDTLKTGYDSAVTNSHTHANKNLLDSIISNGLGTKYLSDDGTYKVVESGSDGVTSVNGQTGIVVLDTDDISDSVTTNKFVTQSEKDKLNTINNSGLGNKYLTDNGTYKTIIIDSESLIWGM